MSDDRVSGETELLAQDFMSAWRHVPIHRRIFQIVVIWAVCLPVVLWSSLQGGAKLSEPDFLAKLLPSCVLVLGGIAFVLWSPRAWAKRSLESVGAGRIQVRFDEEGFSYVGPAREIRLGWSAVPQVLQAGENLLVFTSAQTLLLVPKRAFTESQLVEVHRLLGAHTRTTPPGSPMKIRLVLWLVLVVVFLSIWHFSSLQAP